VKRNVHEPGSPGIQSFETPVFILKIPARHFTAPDDFPGAAEIILQFFHDDFAGDIRLPTSDFRLALPLPTRLHEEAALDAFIRAQLQRGQRLWEVPDLATLHRLRSFAGGLELDITADWSFYAFNRVACGQLHELGLSRRVCSPEDTLRNILALASFPPVPEVLVFQHAPLLISEHAPNWGKESMASDVQEFRMAKSQTPRLLHFQANRRHITVSDAPYSALGHRAELLKNGVRHFRCDFSYSPPATLFAEAWRGLLSPQPPLPRNTANLAIHPLP